MNQPVTWSRMRTFLAVADAGSVRAAAAQLHVSEPAVSAAITSMERQLHTQLTAKSGRGIVMTEAGRVYVDYCRQILGLLEESATAVRRAGLGQLRLGAVGTASEYLVPTLLGRFREHYPDVQVSLAVSPRDDLFTAIRSHELDVVFAGRPPRGSGLLIGATRENRLIVVAAPGHEGAPFQSTWLLRGPGSGTLETTLSLFDQDNADPHTLTLGSLGAVIAGAKAGLGLTLVHADAVADDLAEGRLVQIRVPRTPIARPWHLVTGSRPTAVAALFISSCTSDDLEGAAFTLQRRTAGH
ncbi:MAG: LysR family transcriptional regulator [Pseudonocardiaceae bacterium]|nr:MAG: LysR family transcriptional regulator [Pseudonocardiaceae bacterium]